MRKNRYKVIGVMSGTSLDGVDLVEVAFEYTSDKTWNFDVLSFKTVGYTSHWKKQLRDAINFSKEKIEHLDLVFTHYLSEILNDFIKANNIENIDAVCSHGHTIFHVPSSGFTKQIGNRKELSALIGQDIVCDFRVQDVALGGQGAPLVPIGDLYLFPNFDYCINLGGFANISFHLNDRRLAYDICPVNIVLNHLASKLNLPYDHDGEHAKSGKVNLKLLKKLNALPYYKKKAPKSLGVEWVQENIFPLFEGQEKNVKDLLATFSEHVAIQISAQLKNNSSVLITGGGAYNQDLIERIKIKGKFNINIPEKQIIEYKEAIIFGLLGVLKLRNEINCLASVTGASRDHSSGVIFKTNRV